MKIVIPTFLLAIGFSAVQAKSVYLRPDEADEKSQLERRKLRRALQTDSSMSLPELTQRKWLYIASLYLFKSINNTHPDILTFYNVCFKHKTTVSTLIAAAADDDDDDDDDHF